MQITIRQMLPADIELGMRLKAEAGWNQIEANWRRAIALEPDGCFVAEADGLPVGTTTTCTFGPVAWVAMVLVDARFRGAGIGRALLDHALAHLDRCGIASVRLDATPLGRPLYEKLGFVAEYELARFAGQPATIGILSPQVEPATADDVDPIASLDFQSSGTDRARLLRYVLADEHCVARVVRSSSGLAGCILDRPGAVARQIGPCLGTESAAIALLSEALNRNAGQNVYVDIPFRQERACELAAAHGLVVQRPLLRMTRGPLVAERPEFLWASFGPEKG
jgi:GNAT superfamily N-acetyltransferase